MWRSQPPQQTPQASLKRPRSRSVGSASSGSSRLETPSRSPSPERPRASVDTQLGAHNAGYAMLLRMGWVAGRGLGAAGDGRIEPVPLSEKRGADLAGIGKLSLDIRTVEASTSTRRELPSERMSRESEAERSARLDEAARQATQRLDAEEARAAFRCELCNKGYAKPSAYETHLTSYDHHHRKRLKELAAAEKARGGGGTERAEKRRAKEAAREAKELARLTGTSVAPKSALLAAGASTLSMGPTSAGGSGGAWKSSLAPALPAPPPGPPPGPPPQPVAPVARSSVGAFRSAGFGRLETSDGSAPTASAPGFGMAQTVASGFAPLVGSSFASSSSSAAASSPSGSSRPAGFAPVGTATRPSGVGGGSFKPLGFARAEPLPPPGAASTGGFRPLAMKPAASEPTAPPPPPLPTPAGAPPPPPPPPDDEPMDDAPPPPPPPPDDDAPPPPPP